MLKLQTELARQRLVKVGGLLFVIAQLAAIVPTSQGETNCFQGLVALWAGENNALDSVGTNQCMLLNGATFGVGKVGMGFSLDGIDDGAVVSNAPGLNFGTGNFSVEAWIKALPNSSQDGVETVISKRQVQGAVIGWEIFLQDGKLSFQYSDPNGGGQHGFGSSGPNLKDSTFHHIAVTMQRNSATGGKMYVDGVSVGTFDPTLDPGDMSNQQPLLIGSHPSPTQNSFFKGIVDEVSLYNSALSDADVQGIHFVGAAGKCGPPIIRVSPVSCTNNAGTTAVFAVSAVRGQPLSYRWLKNGAGLNDGGNVSGATTTNLVMSSVQITDAASYRVVVSNVFGSVTSSVATLTVISGLPTITTQPTSRTNNAGTVSTFSVDNISGSEPFYYRWRKNGADLADGGNVSGVNSVTLIVSNVLGGNGGTYDVVVTNAFGSATSGNAMLTVIDPVIIAQPTDRIAIVVESTTFNVGVIGTPPIFYQWRFNGEALPGATGSSLTLASVTTSDAGFYSVIVSNAYGTAISADATMFAGTIPHLTTVIGWDTYTSNLTDVPFGLTNVTKIAVGESHTLALKSDGRVIAWGSDGIGQCSVPPDLTNAVAIGAGISHSLAVKTGGSVVQWGHFGGVDIPATLTNAIAVAGGDFFSVALKSTGKVVAWGLDPEEFGSSEFHVGQLAVPSLSSVVAIAAGVNHSLALKSTGKVVGWGYDGQESPGQDYDPDYDPTAVPADVTNVVGIAAGTVSSFALKVDGTVRVWGWGYDPPDGLSNVVAIADHLALKRDGTVVAWDWTGWRYVPPGLSNVVAIARKETRCVAIATNLITAPPIITSQPISRTNMVQTTATFTVQAVAPPFMSLGYQWQKNGVNLTDGSGNVSGANTATLKLSDVQTTDDGTYTVVVLTAGGGTLSVPVTLTVLDPPFFPLDISQGLVSWWRAESNAFDSVGTNHGTLAGDVSFGPGKIGSGFVLDGYRDYVRLGSPSSLKLQNFTIETWVKRASSQAVSTSGGVGAGIGMIFAWGQGGYGLYLENSGRPVLTKVGVNNVAPSGALINDTAFHHLAVTKSGATIVFYLDGVAHPAANYDPTFDFVGDLRIGAWDHTTSGAPLTTFDGSGFYGTIDELSVYNRPLTTAEVQAIYHALSPGRYIWSATSRTNNAGSVATFTVTAFGGQPMNYQWLKNGSLLVDGGNVSGATSTNLVLSNVLEADEASYTVIISNKFGMATSAPSATLTVVFGLAEIGTQPTSRTNNAVTTATFSVGNITGSEPFYYQWRKDGVELSDGGNVSGATTARLTVSNLLKPDDGNYSVVISNEFGFVVSSSATLVVIDPFITIQPSGRIARAGGSATFTVGTAGTSPIFYQWRRNGIALSGATDATLILASVTASNAGSYSVVVSNIYGTTASVDAGMTVLPNNGFGRVFGWGGEPWRNVPPDLTNVVEVAVGSGDRNLALKADGTVVAWSPTGYTTNVPAGLSNVVAISDAFSHSVALKEDRTVVAWGDNTYGLTNVPAGLQDVVAVYANGLRTVALKGDGTVVAWGWNPQGYNYIYIPSGLTNATAIAVASGHVLALKADGTVLAWGQDVPTNLASVVAIAAGGRQSLALKSDGTLVAWGAYFIPPVYFPTYVPSGLSSVVSIAEGGNHSLAIKSDGTVIAWGRNTEGQTNVPPGLSNVVSIAGGSQHSLAVAKTWTPFPVIIAQPASRSNNAGTTVIFTVRAGSLFPTDLGFQWQRNGVDLVEGANVSGVTTTNLTLLNVQDADAGIYTVVVTNAFGTTTSLPATLTVVTTPLITAQPQPASRTNNAGTTATFTVSVLGPPPLNYQWRKNGINLSNASNVSGANSATLAVANVLKADEASYSVVVSNSFGTAVSSDATLSVIEPVIYSQPADQIAPLGSGATFSVGVAGTQPISYQWRKNGVALSGATNATLTLTGLTTNNSGIYSVVITNAFGSVTSENAVLSLDTGLRRNMVIEWGIKVSASDRVLLSLTNVTAISANLFHCLALRQNGTVVSWGDEADWNDVPLDLTNATAIAAGTFFSLALQGGKVVSWGEELDDYPTDPESLSNLLAIAAGGYHALAIKSNHRLAAWGYNDEGQSSVPYTTTAAAVAAGDLHSLVMKSGGDVVAWGNNDFGQIDVPEDLTDAVAIAAGAGHSLAARENGTVVGWGSDWEGESTDIPDGLSTVIAVAAGETFSLALKRNGTVVGWGQPKTPDDLTNVMKIAAGPSTALAIVTNWMVVPPVIAEQPGSRTNLAGTTAIFTVRVASPPLIPLSHQWRKNGVELVDGGTISGATTETLILGNVQVSDAGSYTLVAVNAAGGATSLPAVLTVIDPPVIMAHPACCTNVMGTTASFTVSATGGQPMNYCWKKNGSILCDSNNVSGATTPHLSLSNVQIADTATYTVTIGNMAGSKTSSEATLLVAVPPVITTQPQGGTVPAGGSATLTVAANGTPAPGYQWFLKSAPISDATGSSLPLANFQSANEGAYHVLVTNVAGSVQSDIAELYLDSELKFLSTHLEGNSNGIGVFRTRLIGHAGGRRVIEVSTNLPHWTPLQTNEDPSGFIYFIDTNSLSEGQHWYRARLAP